MPEGSVVIDDTGHTIPTMVVAAQNGYTLYLETRGYEKDPIATKSQSDQLQTFGPALVAAAGVQPVPSPGWWIGINVHRGRPVIPRGLPELDEAVKAVVVLSEADFSLQPDPSLADPWGLESYIDEARGRDIPVIKFGIDPDPDLPPISLPPPVQKSIDSLERLPLPP